MRKLFVLLLAAVFAMNVSSVAFANPQVISGDYLGLRQNPPWQAAIYARDYDNKSSAVFAGPPWGEEKSVTDLAEMDGLNTQYNLIYRGVWCTYFPDGVTVLVHLFSSGKEGEKWKYFALVPESRWQNRYDRTVAMATYEKAEDEFKNLISLTGAVRESYPGKKIFIGAEGKLLVDDSLGARTPGPHHLLIDGKETTAPHFAVRGTTFMGVKVIEAVLNVDVQYSEDGKEAKVGGTTFKVGQRTKYGVVRYEHALVVPIRAFCDATGLSVTYDNETDTINIHTPDGRGPNKLYWQKID